jgi:hypothetical protein
MASEVEICNLGLSNIRAAAINSFDDGTVSAINCKLKYPILRDQVLTDAAWQFAHKLKPLNLLTDEVFNWRYAYQYPSDCLYINYLVPNISEIDHDSVGTSAYYRDPLRDHMNLYSTIKYEIININSNLVIVSNEPDLRIDYRAKVTNPNLFTTTFRMALSHLIGAELAIVLAGVEKGAPLRQQELQLYEAYLNNAISANANEQYTTVEDSEYVTVRN